MDAEKIAGIIIGIVTYGIVALPFMIDYHDRLKRQYLKKKRRL